MENITAQQNNKQFALTSREEKAIKASWRREFLSLYLIGVKPPFVIRIFLPKN